MYIYMVFNQLSVHSNQMNNTLIIGSNYVGQLEATPSLLGHALIGLVCNIFREILYTIIYIYYYYILY